MCGMKRIRLTYTRSGTKKHDRVVRLRNLGMKFVTVTHAICKDISNILFFLVLLSFAHNLKYPRYKIKNYNLISIMATDEILID